MMVRQLLVGFEIKIYEAPELKYVLYVLDNLLTVFERNSQVHLRKIDKSLVPSKFGVILRFHGGQLEQEDEEEDD